MKILAIDLGGTNIRSAIVEKTKLFGYLKTPTPKKQKDIIKKLFEIIESYGSINAVCVSTAGFERGGIIVNSPNNDMEGAPLSKLLKSRFKKSKIFIRNDAKCAALAELYYGVGKGKRNFILLTLGSGIGGAAIVNGKLWLGEGGAPEPGAGMRIDHEEIFEHLASGRASVKFAHEFGLNVDSFQLEEMANKGDKKAKEVYDKIGYYLGMGIANLVYLFDPQEVVIGGGFSRVKYIYPEMQRSYEKFYGLNPKPKIVKAKFGDDAGLIGAALLVKEENGP
jgi:glucokinase